MRILCSIVAALSLAAGTAEIRNRQDCYNHSLSNEQLVSCISTTRGGGTFAYGDTSKPQEVGPIRAAEVLTEAPKKVESLEERNVKALESQVVAQNNIASAVWTLVAIQVGLIFVALITVAAK